MAINIYSVSNDLEEHGWKLISTTYKNLKTPLKIMCPCGHEIEETYERWRKYHTCEVCIAGNPFQKEKNKVPPKKEGTYRILALDAATNTTGYSVYDDGNLVAFGTYKAPSDETIARINYVKRWLLDALGQWRPDFVGVEHIQLQTFGNNKNQQQVEIYRVLANLQGVLLDLLFEIGIPCELVYSSTWRRVCCIEGKNERESKKKAAQEKVFKWYGVNCTQDEADAICIGKYFVLENEKTWGEKL